MREQFEKLPAIAELLIEAVFDADTGEYVSYWAYKAGYLNGAYYAFQEQQKKIDAIKAIAENWGNMEYTYNPDSTDTKIEQIRICGRKIIDELLK